jgi:putative phosphoribosyl transferase
MRFANRKQAGEQLAERLFHLKEAEPVVLALPRGGVPVGFEIATRLDAPLDVVLVRKIGHPLSPELAVGAIAEGKMTDPLIDETMVSDFGISRDYLEREIRNQKEEISRRRRLYFRDRPPVHILGRTAIVVDDGIATGATMRVALRAVRQQDPAMLVLAVPVAPASIIAALKSEVDEIVCLDAPEDFQAVGYFYADFRTVEDEAVVDFLDRAAKRQALERPPRPP